MKIKSLILGCLAAAALTVTMAFAAVAGPMFELSPAPDVGKVCVLDLSAGCAVESALAVAPECAPAVDMVADVVGLSPGDPDVDVEVLSCANPRLSATALIDFGRNLHVDPGRCSLA